MYVTAYGLHFRGINGLNDLYSLFAEGKKLDYDSMIIDDRQMGLFSVPSFSSDDEFYPSRADLKILRSDTIAAIYAVRRMIKDFSLPQHFLERAGLWVSTGAFEDRLLYEQSKLVRYLKKAFESQDKEQRLKRTYRAIPPMLGLNTLTNATESFVAQYAGIKGRSTTVGNTSASGYYALAKAKQRLEVFGSPLEIVGGANLADTSFFMMWHNYRPVEQPKGLTGGVFLTLQSKVNGTEPIAQLLNLRHFFSAETVSLPITEREVMILSNPYGFELQLEGYKQIIDLYSIAGNAGAVMLYLAVLLAIALIERSQAEAVDCLDIDLYGRISFLTVKTVK